MLFSLQDILLSSILQSHDLLPFLANCLSSQSKELIQGSMEIINRARDKPEFSTVTWVQPFSCNSSLCISVLSVKYFSFLSKVRKNIFSEAINKQIDPIVSVFQSRINTNCTIFALSSISYRQLLKFYEMSEKEKFHKSAHDAMHINQPKKKLSI